MCAQRPPPPFEKKGQVFCLNAGPKRRKEKCCNEEAAKEEGSKEEAAKEEGPSEEPPKGEFGWYFLYFSLFFLVTCDLCLEINL